MTLPIGRALYLFHREVGEYQVRIFGEEGHGFGFVERKPEQLLLAGEGFAELVYEVLFGALDLGEELAAVIGAEGCEGALVILDTI